MISASSRAYVRDGRVTLRGKEGADFRRLASSPDSQVSVNA